MALSTGEALISWVRRVPSELLQCCATKAAGRRVTASDSHDRLPVDWGEDATGDEVDDSPDSDSSVTPHWACAFWMTLVLSSRNINDSWSRYPGHGLRTRTHCVHCGWTLSHCRYTGSARETPNTESGWAVALIYAHKEQGWLRVHRPVLDVTLGPRGKEAMNPPLFAESDSFDSPARPCHSKP